MKQTEIGLIPDDWEVKELGELGEPCMCKRILKDQTRTTGDIPFYKIGTFGGLPDSYISRDLFKEYKSKYNYPQKGTLLLSAAGTIGRVVRFDGSDSYFQDSNIVWINNDERKVTNDFLYYCYTQMQWETEEGGIVSRLYNANLKSTSFIAPKSLAEQQKIAKALSDTDNVISTLEKLIAKKSNIKQGTMQCLLTGKKRLPGFAKSANFKQTEIGEIPEDWEVKELGSIVKILMGQSPDSSCYNTNQKGLVLIQGNADIEQRKTIIRFYTSHITKTAKKGDLILTVRAPVGNIAKATFDCCIGRGVCSLKNGNEFLYQYLIYIENFWSISSTGSTFDSINSFNLAKTLIIFPTDNNEQIAIAKVLSDMDKEIDELNAKVKKYRNLKIGMMQQLLTGKIRLIDSNAPVVKSKKDRSAPLAFKRSVLAAEIANRLCDEPTFGHVKMEKLLFLAEKMCNVDIGSSYHRDAAGPYDNRGIRSIDSQLEKQRWFKAVKKDKKYCYIPLENRGGHVEYFERYCAGKKEIFDYIIKIFRRAKTEQCEIIATLYSAWEDFLKQGITPTDEQIVNEVLTNWHEAKKRISEDRWLSALGWMKEKGFVP